MELTSLDLSILMEDFKELEDGHVQKVYQRKHELTVEVYVGGEGKKRVIIGPNHVFLSKYKRDNPTRPPGFAMELRKHLGKIDSVEQRGFDRILEIKSGDVKLVCEVFGKGNFILVKEGKIIGALRQEDWADRTIAVGEEYVYPEPAPDPREMENYIESLGEGELVRQIASKLSLGGTYAEEICERLGIEKDKHVEELTEKEVEKVNREIENFLYHEIQPRIYKKDEELKRAVPFPLETYSEYDEEEFERFSEALDEFFYRREKRKEERQKKKAYRERKEGLERQLEQQERKIEGLKRSAKENREKAELIYKKYGKLTDIQQMVEDAINKHGWKKTREKLDEVETEASEMIKGLNEQEEFFTVEVDGMSIKLEPEEDLEAIASGYYDKAKASESKIENAKKAKEQTEKQLEELKKEEIDLEEVMEDKTQKREKEWFEKYRWFYSSEGFLVLIGRDVQTNDMLVNKHMESNDLYFHADFDGAPSVVVKDGQESGEETREQAAKAAVSFAKTWKAGIGSDNTYYVTPDKVTQEPESGEYLPKGAFIIRGDRNYIRNVKVEVAIGPYEIEEGLYVPMAGPLEAVKENCSTFVEVEPGRTKKSDIAKDIRSYFKEQDFDLDLDYIVRSLPPGESDIKSKK
jgi:predicted ribosome quality control (RQC) complex YloA/Tae2 family protein